MRFNFNLKIKSKNNKNIKYFLQLSDNILF